MIEKQTPKADGKISPLRVFMRLLGRLLSGNKAGDNTQAVEMIHRIDRLKDVLKVVDPLHRSRRGGKNIWPVTSGSYILGDPLATIAVCTLTSPELMQPLARLPGVAIAGSIYTPNLGIEKIIRNVTANRALRFLVLCGKESPIFYPAQALRALLTVGITPDKLIIDAQGPLPILKNLPSAQIAAFCRQIELVDCTGTTDLVVLANHIQALALTKRSPFAERWEQDAGQSNIQVSEAQSERFTRLRPGGKRQPLAYDPKGFFIITLNRPENEIIVRHYLPANVPAHEMRGRSAESLILGLLRENLLSQLSHAGYLGVELAKAEAALRFGWQYEQDRPLRPAVDGPMLNEAVRIHRERNDKRNDTTQ